MISLNPKGRIYETHEDQTLLHRFWCDTYVSDMNKQPNKNNCPNQGISGHYKFSTKEKTMKLVCNLEVNADNFPALKRAVEEELSECIMNALPENEGGSVTVSGSTDSSGSSSVTVSGTVSW